MADTINTLKQRAHDLRNEWTTILGLQAEGKQLTDEQKARAVQLSALVPKVQQEVLDEEKRLAGEDAQCIARARARGITGIGEPYHEVYGRAPADDDAPAASALPPLPGRTRAAIARLYPQASGVDAEQRDLQWRGVLAAALGGQPLHPAILAATALDGAPEDGGFWVTPEVAVGIFMRAAEESVWLRIGARLEAMISETKIVQAIDDADETDDAEGTLKADWQGEGTDNTDPQLLRIRQVKLTARKLLVLAAASNEVSDDALGYVPALEAAIARAIGKKFDRALMSGTGAGMPLGVLNAPCTITVSKETGQPAATFRWENVVKMWARLAPGSHERSWWLMSPTVLPQALSMSLVIGTGGTQPRGVFEAGGPTGYMLLGRPVVTTSRVKQLGTKGDVVLVDPTQIAVGIRRGITVERSAHAFFSSDRLAIRGKFRGDARPLWEKAQTPVEGTTTVGPVVVLADRA